MAILLALACLFLSPCASAGNIFFDLSIGDNKIMLVNRGDSSAYYPTLRHLLADGRWENVGFLPGTAAPAELQPGQKIGFVWDSSQSPRELAQLAGLQAIMVRFYDQAGADFGQISFFTHPPLAAEPLAAAYRGGRLTIAPPTNGSIRASWLLWPQEGGIDPLRRPVDFNVDQPPARRIEWHAGMGQVSFDLGAGQPSAILVHETAQGLFLQNIPGGGLQGRAQRASWLDASNQFYGLGLAIAVLAIGIVLAPLAAARFKKAAR